MRHPSGELDFEDAALVFAGPYFEVEDIRKEFANGASSARKRLVVIGYTPRGADRHVFSMREANDREQARIAPLLGL